MKSSEILRRHIDIVNESQQLPISEVAPKGWEGTVKAMKKHPDVDNPWALAHYMKKKGYKSHKKESVGIDEKWDTETKVSPEEKGKYAGKTRAELLKSYNALKKSGPHPQGTPEFGRMRELAFAIRAKGGWGRVQ